MTADTYILFTVAGTAYALPSRVGNRLHYPDGRVETIKP